MCTHTPGSHAHIPCPRVCAIIGATPDVHARGPSPPAAAPPRPPPTPPCPPMPSAGGPAWPAGHTGSPARPQSTATWPGDPRAGRPGAAAAAAGPRAPQTRGRRRQQLRAALPPAAEAAVWGGTAGSGATRRRRAPAGRCQAACRRPTRSAAPRTGRDGCIPARAPPQPGGGEKDTRDGRRRSEVGGLGVGPVRSGLLRLFQAIPFPCPGPAYRQPSPHSWHSTPHSMPPGRPSSCSSLALPVPPSFRPPTPPPCPSSAATPVA